MSSPRTAFANPIPPVPPASVIFGQTESMRAVQEKLALVASANVPVLIQGESGTGKEIIARLIHMQSPWNNGPYVKISCPAIPGTLIESELFGYEKGGFTGAFTSKAGRVELAHRGTLFLDEIGEMQMSLQSKLLQLLQDGQFCRIGAQEDKKVEVRVVCATNRHLENEIEEGNFRQDLYYRINVMSLTLPPLRERASDIPLLVDYFIETFNQTYNRRTPPLSRQLIQILTGYRWPGNVRELENIIKRYVIFGTEDAITPHLLAPRHDAIEFHMPLNGELSLKKLTKEATLRLERSIIMQVLQANQWNRKKAAHALKISYRALLYKIRDTGLPSVRSKVKSFELSAK